MFIVKPRVAVPLIIALSMLGAVRCSSANTSPDLFKVVSVVDGDTIKVDVGGSVKTVRYIGINTPETVDPNRPVEPYGPEASVANKQLVRGKMVRLEKDVSETDKFGRLLRYVYVDDVMVNAWLVEHGYAQAVSYPPDVKYQDLFTRLQREARGAQRGFWGLSPAKTPGGGASPTPKYDPNGPDRDCGDFKTQAEAQAFYIAAGGPARDPHHLDADGNGKACESLP